LKHLLEIHNTCRTASGGKGVPAVAAAQAVALSAGSVSCMEVEEGDTTGGWLSTAAAVAASQLRSVKDDEGSTSMPPRADLPPPPLPFSLLSKRLRRDADPRGGGSAASSYLSLEDASPSARDRKKRLTPVPTARLKPTTPTPASSSTGRPRSSASPVVTSSLPTPTRVPRAPAPRDHGNRALACAPLCASVSAG